MSELITQRDAVTKSYKRYQETLTRPLGLYGTDTGHHTINMVTGGHVPTKITTFAARSSFGKTALFVPMAEAAARVVNDTRSEILCLSWEMESSYLVDRYVCWKTGVTLSQLRYARTLDTHTQKLIINAYQEASRLPVHYHHYSANIEAVVKLLDDFLEKVHKKSMIEGIKIQPVMFLDFIGRAKGSSKYANKGYDLTEFLQGLKQECNKTDLAAFILAQINRSADAKEFPEVSDLSDSQGIEQNSDSLAIGHRPEQYGITTMMDPETGGEIASRNKVLVRFVKAREAAAHDTIMNCDMRYFRFWSKDFDRWDYPYFKLYEDENFWKANLGML